jgi:hypothetical protein
MVLRERRGPGGPREERGESRATRQMELRRHAEVRMATAGHRIGTGAHSKAGGQEQDGHEPPQRLSWPHAERPGPATRGPRAGTVTCRASLSSSTALGDRLLI